VSTRSNIGNAGNAGNAGGGVGGVGRVAAAIVADGPDPTRLMAATWNSCAVFAGRPVSVSGAATASVHVQAVVPDAGTAARVGDRLG
jgi:hypothetical protein